MSKLSGTQDLSRPSVARGLKWNYTIPDIMQVRDFHVCIDRSKEILNQTKFNNTKKMKSV